MLPNLLKADATAWYGSARFWLLRSTAEAQVTTDDRWFGVDELAEYLGVSRYTIYSWLTKGTLPGHRVGKFWKFKKDDVDAWVKAGEAAAPTAQLPSKTNRETHRRAEGPASVSTATKRNALPRSRETRE